jgi:hypothetical protein
MFTCIKYVYMFACLHVYVYMFTCLPLFTFIYLLHLFPLPAYFGKFHEAAVFCFNRSQPQEQGSEPKHREMAVLLKPELASPSPVS